MLKAFLRILADAVVVASALFLAAGTVHWLRAWILLAVLIVVRAVSAVAIFRVNPALLNERATVLMHHGQPVVDKLILFAFMGTAFIGVPAIAAIDVFHTHVSRNPPVAVASIGLVLFALGWMIIGFALCANPFAATVVRLQHERQHALVDSGVYGMVRHPMYAANLLVNVGLSIWLGSYAGALFAVIPLALLMVRITHEERFLRRELAGYPEYQARIRYRLLPGIW